MNAIVDLLNRIDVAEPVVAGSTFMFPIFGTDDPQPGPLLFEEALKSGTAEVSEISTNGSVPELQVFNRAKRALFLLDGEQVIGLKQNRTFNLSMLLPSESSTLVPVSCLERGRWCARGGRAESAEHVHFAKGRASKMRSVGNSLASFGDYRSDQMLVWAHIDEKFAESRASSDTSAEADYYLERRTELEPRARKFAAKKGQVGALFGIGNRILGVDVFGSSKIYEGLWLKIAKSYLLEAVDVDAPALPPTSAEARRMIETLLSAPTRAFAAPGLGETWRFNCEGATGAALVVNNRCIHAVALCDA